MENNWEEAFAVEVALDQDAVTLLQSLMPPLYSLGRVLEV